MFPDIDTLSLCNHSPIIGYFHYYKQNLYEQSCTDFVWTNDKVFISMAQCPGVSSPGHMLSVYLVVRLSICFLEQLYNFTLYWKGRRDPVYLHPAFGVVVTVFSHSNSGV